MKPDIELLIGTRRFFLRSLNGRARDWIMNTFHESHMWGPSAFVAFMIEYLDDIKDAMRAAKMEWEEARQ